MENSKISFWQWWQDNAGDYKALLFDVDGTLISGSRMLPGADLLINWLRKHDFPFYLLTNDGNHSTQQKSELMRRTGLQIGPEEIVSCSMALNQYVAEHDFYGKTMFVMGELGEPCYALNAGLRVSRDLEKIDACDGIIVGEGFYDWYKTINAVFNYLNRAPDRPLLVPNPDSYWPDGTSDGFGIGAGGKARFICGILAEMGIEIEPVYLGKPYPAIYDYTLELLKHRFKLDSLPHDQIMMLGDSLKSDILGANKLGINSALLLTGITTEEQANAAGEEQQPDFVFQSLV